MARKFGLEVEFVGSMTAVQDALRAEGLAVENRTHTHLGHSLTQWSVKRDGSVQRGGELVSPPLDFDDPEQRGQVDRAMACLQRAGAQPHPSAGIHVHIEATNNGRPMTGAEIAAVVRFTYKFEDAIYRIASSGWETIRGGARTYAKPIPEATARAIMEVKTRDELDRVWSGRRARVMTRQGAGSTRLTNYLDRYTATNLKALEAHGTIEFRYFNSSVNAVRVQTYIALCMAIVQDARNGYSRSVAKSYPVGSMLTGRVTEKALMLRLQQVLRSNSKDTKVCMSEEDWKNLRKVCWKDSKPQEAFYTY